MKKFLSKEESKKLMEIIDPSWASYVEKNDQRFDTITMSMIQYFSIESKKDCSIRMYNSTTGELISEDKNYNEEDSRFSIGDLIRYIDIMYAKSINEVLEEMNWNFYMYEETDSNELINYLYKWILEND